MKAQSISQSEAQNPETDSATECPAHPMNRRRFLQTTAAAGAAIAIGSGTAAADHAEDEDFIDDSFHPNFESDYVHDPWINATVKVSDHNADMENLEYIDDADVVQSLEAHGYVLARDPEDEDTIHNPVTLKASDFVTDEFTAFPRGATYDDDADSATDEVPVYWHETDHWSTDETGSSGTATLNELGGDAVQISTSGNLDGETITLTFDLSSVASEDVTISDGMARKILQNVVDIDALPSGSKVTFAVIDSAANEVTASYDPAGDATTAAVLTDSTGDSQVVEARVGALEDDQAVTLQDIEKLEIRIKDDDVDFTLHALNLERAAPWTFGTEEYQTTNDDGETVVETRDVETPSGSFGITNLSTLNDTPFHDAEINLVEYDAEMRASHLPENRVHARLTDTPEAFNLPAELEIVAEFEAPTAYSLDITHAEVEDTVELPSGRYSAVQVASDVVEIDEWEDDVEDGITWTGRTDKYTTVDEDVELLATVDAADRTVTRHRTLHRESETSAVQASSGAAVVVGEGGGGGGGLFDQIGGWLTVVAGLGLGAIAMFRKSIMGVIGR